MKELNEDEPVPEQPPKPVVWNPRNRRAAALLAAGRHADREIAEILGVRPGFLARMRKRPEFNARVEELVQARLKEAQRLGVASMANRIRAQQDRHNRMQRLMDARAEELKDVPGGDTGLLVHTQKAIGAGLSQKIVDEYRFDKPLVDSMLEHEERIAREVGQWGDTDKAASSVVLMPIRIVEVNVSGGETIAVPPRAIETTFQESPPPPEPESP